MKITEKQLSALQQIGKGMSGALWKNTHPATRASLLRKGLVKKDFLHQHSIPGALIEYLKLTEAGLEASGANVF